MKCIFDNIIIMYESKNALFLCLSWSQHSFQIVIIVLCIFDTYLPPDVDTLTTVMFVLLNVCHSSRTRLGSPIKNSTEQTLASTLKICARCDISPLKLYHRSFCAICSRSVLSDNIFDINTFGVTFIINVIDSY